MESELLENKMGCGHPRACWVEDKDSLSHLDSFYRKQIDKGMFNEDQIDSLKRDNSYCTVCAELSRVRQQARADAIEQCAIEAGERSPEGVSSHTMLGDMWDERIRNCRALIHAEAKGAPKESK